jgi:hypothetical protein
MICCCCCCCGYQVHSHQEAAYEAPTHTKAIFRFATAVQDAISQQQQGGKVVEDAGVSDLLAMSPAALACDVLTQVRQGEYRN